MEQLATDEHHESNSLPEEEKPKKRSHVYSPPPKEGPTGRGRINAAIKKFEGRSFTRKDIEAECPDIPMGSISSQISVLKSQRVLMVTERGVYKQINPKKEIRLVPPPEPQIEEKGGESEYDEIIDLDNLTVESIEELFMLLLADYKNCKRDCLDLRSMLNRIFGQMKKEKILPKKRMDE